MPFARGSRLLVALLMLASPSVAFAEGWLYRCHDPAGAVSIQSTPCAKGSTQVWKRPAAPEPPPSPEQMAEAAQRRQKEAEEARALSLMAGTAPLPEPPPTPPPPPPPAPAESEASTPAAGPCRRAHTVQATIRDEMPWLELRVTQERRISEWVEEQCKQPGQERP